MKDHPVIDLINHIADQTDPVIRVKALIHHIRGMADAANLRTVLDEMDEKASFIASAIVSGGHVHLVSVEFTGEARGG